MIRTHDASKGFRPDIEGLRGVAVLLVVFGHLTGWPRGGFIGVDVFFVISGFLITGLLVSERERTGRISIRQFYVRRARRLLPAGVLVLMVTDIVATVLLLPGRAHETAVDSLWVVGLLANVHFAAVGTDYFSLFRPPSAVQQYWSLAVEEQFYLLWPCLVLLSFALARRIGVAGRKVVVGSAALVVAGSLTWSILSTPRNPAAAYFSSPARAWELGAGALLVLLSPRRLPSVLAWFGAAGLVVSVLVITPSTPVPGYALLLPVASTLLLLAAGGERLGLASRRLRYLGKISYSLYLWHWPCIVLGATLPGGTSPVGKTGLLLLAVLLSAASYAAIEQPFRYRPKRARVRALGRVAVPSYALLLVVALTIAWFGVTSGGTHVQASVADEPATLGPPNLSAEIAAGLRRTSWPDGFDSQLKDAASPEWFHDGCLDVNDRNAARCVYGPVDGSRTIALLGDSVAVSWLPAMRRADALKDVRIHVLTQRQCPAARGFVPASCARHQDWALAQVRRLRPDLVVLSSRYQGRQTSAQWESGTAQTLREVAPYAGRLVVLAPPPDSGNLQDCYTRLSSPQDCTLPVSDRWRAYATAEQEGVGSLGKFVDPRPWFCADSRCPAVVDGLPVMWDGRHITAAYAAHLAPALSTLFR